MLPILSSFLLKHGVRNPMQLLNPKMAPLEDIVLPRGITYHYLDFDTDVMFPTLDDFFVHGIPDTKKIPIYHVPALDLTEGHPLIVDKQTPRKIRKWTLANIKHFRRFPILEEATSENLTVPIVNYNVVKHMYKYPNSVISRHNRSYNLFHTLYNSMKKVMTVNRGNVQVLEIKLPSSLPSFAIMQRLAGLQVIKQSRVVTNTHMKQVLDVFTWLDADQRSKTAFNVFNENDSGSLMLMFNYKNHVAFVPFSVIVGLLNTNEIPSKLKLPADRVQKIFLRFLRLLQSKAEGTDVGDVAPVEETQTTTVEPQIVQDEEGNDNEDENKPVVSQAAPKSDAQYKSVADLDNVDISGMSEDAASALDKNDDDGDDSNETIDASYLADITKAENDNSVLPENDEEPEPEVFSEASFTATDEEIQQILHEGTAEEKADKEFQELVSSKLVSYSEISARKKLKAARAGMKSPYSKDEHIDTYKVVTPEQITIKETDRNMQINNDLVSDSIKESSLRNMDKNYVKSVMPKDIVACVMHIENAGLTVKEYSVEASSTAMGHYETHRIVVKPLKGQETPLYFRVPKVSSEGNFTAAGIKYKMKRQRADLPIRKISHNEVKLSSYYGKLFVSSTERKAFDTLAYINDYIKELYFSDDKKASPLQKVVLGNVYKNTYKLPVVLASLSRAFSAFKIGGNNYLFDQAVLHEYVDEPTLKALSANGYYFCGYAADKKAIVCDMTDTFYIYGSKTDISPIGKIEHILNIDPKKLPVSFTAVKLLGKDLPLGVAIAYYKGLTSLIKLLKPTMTVLPSGKRYELSESEWMLRFADYKLIFNRKDKEATLILSGFNFFRDFIKQYNFSDFDSKNIYMNMVEERDFGIWHLKELDILNQLFIDPITADELKLMKEPDTFIPLLMRASAMLTDYSYPNINSTRYSRIKGYERVPGIIYKSLTEVVRNYKFKNTVKGKPEMSPYAVWNNITQDTSVKIVEDINPVMNLKEMEAVTLGGSDGIGKDMVASKLREYHEDDMGLMSESSGDGSDVAINTFLSSDPKFKDLRGNVDMENTDHLDDPKKLLSTSSLLSVGMNYDD